MKSTTSAVVHDGSSTKQPPNDRKLTFYRRVYTFLGFQKSYNFPLFIIFAGAMLGFTLARLQYLNLSGNFAKNATPGDWYWYRANHYRVGISIHLGCILPAGLLMVWQFIPAIRHKAILFHRINGYLIILLVLVSNVGALMIVRRSFGGELATQGAVGVLVILTTLGLGMAYINIKRLQIDQHRAWMLRTMFYLGTIITTRLIMIIAAQITTLIGSYFVVYTCDEIRFIHNNDLAYMQQAYPACGLPGSTNSSGQAVVHADFKAGTAEAIGASLRLNFGMAIWIAFFMHLVGVEIYLNLTPREAQRLRQVSYERQLEAGYESPGSAGLVVERWGDADEWKPSGEI
ncbi:hypothetical protein MMC26_001801 [Xylographa opegraphella]|nr:hypothetical protein [Xylographa opegraphella]